MPARRNRGKVAALVGLGLVMVVVASAGVFSALAGREMVPVPSVTISIDGATVHYFDVSGSTSSQVIESIQTNSVASCGQIDYSWYSGDTRPVACAQVAYRYQTEYVDAGCRVKDVTVQDDVYFPQWTSPSTVQARLADWWRKLIEVVRKHEAGHVDIAVKWLPTFRGKMVGLSCTQASATFTTAMTEITALQEAYDKEQYSTQVFPKRPD